MHHSPFLYDHMTLLYLLFTNLRETPILHRFKFENDSDISQDMMPDTNNKTFKLSTTNESKFVVYKRKK